MKTKLILLLLILTTSYLNAQIVNIPDPEFKSYLLYNFDTNNDNQIQVTEAEAATGGIYVPGDPFVWGEITDLTGIEAFVNIAELQCQLNLIDQPVDLSQNLALMRVICYDNSIPSLTLGNNEVLTELDCHENNITSLDVSQCSALEDLDCHENGLTSINTSQNLLLKYFRCYDNSLLSLDLFANEQLELLNCHDNQIDEIDISQNLVLKELHCGHNLLMSIDVVLNVALERFSCNANSLLESVNIRNENNINITYFNSLDNPYLACIFVDNSSYSSNNWLNIDEESHFVETQEQCDAIGVDDFLLKQIDFYPNPVNDYLNIKVTNKPIKIIIINMIGEIMYASHLKTNQTNEIDISHFNSGIYILSIQANTNQSLTHKIIKL